MNAENFERQLQQQPFRSIPPIWREQVLKSTEAAALAQHASEHLQTSGWLRELIWPCPQAWAAIATVWLIILGLHSFAGPNTPSSPAPLTAAPPTPELRAVFAEQRRLLAELLTETESILPMPPEPVERPRSQLFWPLKNFFTA